MDYGTHVVTSDGVAPITSDGVVIGNEEDATKGREDLIHEREGDLADLVVDSVDVSIAVKDVALTADNGEKEYASSVVNGTSVVVGGETGGSSSSPTETPYTNNSFIANSSPIINSDSRTLFNNGRSIP
ncbi:hypothetical protein ACLOJK_004712 [Asimina triloba]